MSCTRTTPFIIFDSDYDLSSCALYKLNTLWNIFMLLDRNVEHDKTTCCMEE